MCCPPLWHPKRQRNAMMPMSFLVQGNMSFYLCIKRKPMGFRCCCCWELSKMPLVLWEMGFWCCLCLVIDAEPVVFPHLPQKYNGYGGCCCCTGSAGAAAAAGGSWSISGGVCMHVVAAARLYLQASTRLRTVDLWGDCGQPLSYGCCFVGVYRYRAVACRQHNG